MFPLLEQRYEYSHGLLNSARNLQHRLKSSGLLKVASVSCNHHFNDVMVHLIAYLTLYSLMVQLPDHPTLNLRILLMVDFFCVMANDALH